MTGFDKVADFILQECYRIILMSYIIIRCGQENELPINLYIRENSN
jgi:hypothetical protein